MGEERTDRKFILDCFQQGLTEVANAKHVEGTTIEEGQQGDQATSSGMTSPRNGATLTQDRVGV